MMKINNIIRTAAFIFAIAVIGMPTFASAQTAAPGTSDSSSKPANAQDYLNQAQKNEANRIESSKGQDSGDNYGLGSAIGSAVGDSMKDVADTASDAWNEAKKGNILGALWGAVKTGASLSLAGIRASINLFDNLDMLGQDVYVYTDPYTGKEKKYVKTLFGGAAATEGNLKGCPPIPIAVADASSCTFCPLFAVIYGAAQEMTELSFAKLAKPIAMALLVGYALYIAFKVLAQVSSFTRQDAPSFINELLVQTFKVLLAFLFLLNPNQIYYYFISPVLGAGLEFGTAMLFQASDMAKQCLSLSVANDTALLPVTLYAKLDCYIRSIQNEIAVTQAVGSSLMCAGRHAAAGKIAGFWDFNMVFQGLFIWAFAIMLSLAFAFYLVDSIVTLGLVGALMPFLIACWPFKITNKYSKTGLDMFLNVFFTFVFMGIVVSINTQLIGQAMNGGTGATASSSTTSGFSSSGSSSSGSSSTGSPSSGSSTGGSSTSVPSSSTSGGLGALAEALSGDDIDTVKQMTDLGFGGFLILVFCCIFGFKFSNQSSTLANKMAGGAGLGIAPNIGGMAARGAKDLGAKATQPARKAVANKANELTGKAGNAVAAKLGLGKFGGKTGANKASSNSGDKGGNGGGNGSTQNRQSPTGVGNNRNNLHGERNSGGGNDSSGANGGDSGSGDTQTQSSGPTGAGDNGGGAADNGGNGGGNGGDTGGNGGNDSGNGNGAGGNGGNGSGNGAGGAGGNS